MSWERTRTLAKVRSRDVCGVVVPHEVHLCWSCCDGLTASVSRIGVYACLCRIWETMASLQTLVPLALRGVVRALQQWPCRLPVCRQKGPQLLWLQQLWRLLFRPLWVRHRPKRSCLWVHHLLHRRLHCWLRPAVETDYHSRAQPVIVSE
ncbi:hypothetical protein DL98DRAFT_296304 [Cadophora sp. DSE1049]|nr:hypothetical protein DL98DRAFT_296304 [Cadophora sp. DSE1049]